jgi:phosphopantothenoylcysteine synthetase/decarboxylase
LKAVSDAAPLIVLGVTGSIAAHRAIDVASQLVKAGADVRVVMTADSLRFVTALPFKTLSRHPVVTDLYDEEEGWKPAHVRLADEAALFLVAPATAHSIARLSLGLADDALSCIGLALNPGARVLIAPAMNGRMWQHPATRQHVATLRERGAEFIGPEEGLLSCGYEGIGRLWPVDGIVERARILAGCR